jgi:hypothetical protein
MTDGVLSAESLRLLDPRAGQPGPAGAGWRGCADRAILCAGAGHFATAHVTLTEGCRIGAGPDAGEQAIARWEQIADRSGEIVPAYGFIQAERWRSGWPRSSVSLGWRASPSR